MRHLADSGNGSAGYEGIPRKMFRGFIALGLAAGVLSVAAAPDDVRRWQDRCPGAADWIASHPEWEDEAMAKRDAARNFARPELREELARRVETEQRLRRRYVENGYRAADQRAVGQVDAENLAWMLKILQAGDFPTAADIGETGLHHLWLLVHHADTHPQFQRVSLQKFEERWRAGEFAADDLARLTDRTLTRLKKPQRFGTQRNWGAADLSSQPFENLQEIEANRVELGLMPLSDYGCMMHELRKSTAR